MQKNYLDHLIEDSVENDPGFAEEWSPFAHMITLTRERVRQGLSQEDLAARIGVDRTAISRMENHPEGVAFARILAYAKAVNAQVIVKPTTLKSPKRQPGSRGRKPGASALRV